MKYPQISVIIPVYNDPKGILVTLKSLVKQDFEDPYEIITVDNNSTDETYLNIEEFIKHHKKPKVALKLLKEDKIQSSYAARNKGIVYAKGEIFVFIDSDMWVDKDFLTKITKAYQEKEEKYFYMGYQVEIVMKGGNLAEKYDKITGFPMKQYLEKEHFVGTGCLVVNRQLVNYIGRFNQKLVSGGDREFGQRVYMAGIKQSFNNGIKIYHPAKESINSLWCKAKRIGRGFYQTGTTKHGLFSEVMILFWRLIPRSPPHILITKAKKRKVKMSLVEFVLLELVDFFVIRIGINYGYLSERFRKFSL